MVGINGSCKGTVKKTHRRPNLNAVMDHDTISMAHGPTAVIANNVVQHLCENLVKPDDNKPLQDSLKLL